MISELIFCATQSHVVRYFSLERLTEGIVIFHKNINFGLQNILKIPYETLTKFTVTIFTLKNCTALKVKESSISYEFFVSKIFWF